MRVKCKKSVMLPASLLALSLIISGCTSSSSIDANRSPARTQRTLRINGDNLGFPQPYAVSTQGRAYLYMSLIFDTLTWKDHDGVVSLLAQNWTISADNRTWTFKLVPNARFHDGIPVTASDVKFSFDYMKTHPNQWVQLNMLQSATVVDSQTVEIVLTDPYAPFLTNVAGIVPILPQHLWRDVVDPIRFTAPEAAIGSGPFKLTSFDSATGTYIYQANTDYFPGAPQVDRIIYAPNSNSNAALLNGDLDVAQNLSYAQSQALATNPDYRVAEGPGLFIVRLYFNFDLPEFQNTAVRQAFCHAINRSEIIRKALNGAGTMGNPGYVSPDSIWYNPDVTQYAFDTARANELLDHNGMMDTNGDGTREYNGRPMRYTLITNGNYQDEALLIQSYLKAVGINVTLSTVSQSTLNSNIQGGAFQLALSGHGSMGGDPVMLAHFVNPAATLGTTSSVTRQGGALWGNATFDDVFERQLSEMDDVRRRVLVNRLQQILADELPTLPLYYGRMTVAWNPATLNGWFFTFGGAGPSVPTAQNKLVFIRGRWGR